MFRLTKKHPVCLTLFAAAALATLAGCDKHDTPPVAGPTTPSAPVVVATGAATTGTARPPVDPQPPVGSSATKPPAAPAWPSPEDCISYNPNDLTVRYEAGSYVVSAGGTEVVRVHGQPGDNTGDKALALAKHYRRHCFIGRTNTRDEHGAYVFDYWRDSSGMNPTIADQEDDCSSYNRGNLTVEDMGGGQGWRVKDHDHVLQLFDNGTDAANGKLVIAKYGRICFIGDNDDDQDVVNYFI